MYPVTNEYKSAVNAADRKWKVRLNIETAFEVLELTENDIIERSLKLKDGVISGTEFSLGGVVAADFSVSIINRDGQYDFVQFNGAIIRPQIGLEVSGDYEWVPLGEFTVDEPVRPIKTPGRPFESVYLQAADNMIKLDRPFSGVQVTFPCSALALLSAVCLHCGVSLATTDFLHDNYMIAARPEGDMTCRDIVSYIAELAGGWARCNRFGQLELGWFKNPGAVQEAEIDGNTDSADGGDFNWWNSRAFDGGAFVEEETDAVLDGTNRYDFAIDDDPIVITGLAFETDEAFLLGGSDRYAMIMSDNPLIQDNPKSVVKAIWERLRGFTFMPFRSYRRDDPAMQAGDMVEHIVNGKTYRTIITEYNYIFGGKSYIAAVGASEAASGYRPYTEKKVSQLRRKIADKQEQINALDLAIVDATNLIASALGGYVIKGEGEYEGNLFISDNPDITQAVRVWRWNIGGFGYSDNGVDGPYETAITADKTIIANALLARIITGEMIKANSITGEHIRANTITGDKIQAGTITGDKLQVDTVEANKLTSAGSFISAYIGEVIKGINIYEGLFLKAGTSDFCAITENPSGGGFSIGRGAGDDWVLLSTPYFTELCHGPWRTNGVGCDDGGPYFYKGGSPHGHTENITISGRTLRFVNGILVSAS
jgi:hypothetical protein